MEIYSDGTYCENNENWHAEDSPWKAEQVYRLLASNRINPSSICDVGCGAGEVLLNLRRYFPDSTLDGFDISPDAFALSKPKGGGNVTFHLGDFLSDYDTQHDVALAIDVFEHVEDYLDFLRRFRKRAKYKIFHIPLDLSVQTVLRGTPLQRVRDLVGHLHFFTKETAFASLAHVGLRIVDWRYTSSGLELPSISTKQRIASWPRRICFALSRDLTVRILGGYSLLVLTE